MTKIPRFLAGLMCSFLVLASLAGCSGGGGGGVFPVFLTSIQVTPTQSSIALGTTAQFTATGVFSDNTKKDLTSSVTWGASNGNAAISNTAGSKGLATGVAAGSTTITATLGGATGSTTLTVTSTTLQSIGITPTTPSIALGTTQQFAATGIFFDGTNQTTQDLTTQVTWSATDLSGTNVATISNAAGTNGLATAGAAGSATITATITVSGSTFTGSTTLTVTPATLVSIAVTPTTPTIVSGTTQQFKATGIFNDNSKQDLTGSATWSSSNHAAATISSGGLAAGVAAGTSTITASFGGTSGTTTLTVTAAPLAAIEVAPLNPGIVLGTGQQFTAIGRFADNSTQDLTTAVTWSSSDTGIAAISNAAGSNGMATSVAAGSTTIAAAFGGVSGGTLLTVKSAAVTLLSIDVEPAIPTIPAGVQQPFTATGTYSDNTTQDLTAAVTWSSSNTVVATISDAAGSKGLTLAIAPGTATITATLGSVSGNTLLTVTSATLASVEVTPPDQTIPKGSTQQFTATGIFNDNSVFDLTPVVTWSSSATTVATVSNDAGSAGLAKGINAGTATITATLGAISGSTSLTVTAVTLSSIAVTPVNPSIAIGTTQQFVATGTYSDSSTRDITQFVTWISSVPSVASISNTGTQKGLATGVKAGSTVITAALGAIVSANDTLTVTNAVLQTITISPPIPPATTVTMASKTSQQFTATGNFDNGTTQDLTRLVTWLTSNKSVAAISNAASTKGVATGVTAGGPITITATFKGISGTASLTVVNATLTGIVILPANPTVAVGTNQQFAAIGSFTGGFTQDLTKAVKWSSSNKNIAISSNGFNSRGLVTAVAAGSATISATKPSTVITGFTTMTVTP